MTVASGREGLIERGSRLVAGTALARPWFDGAGLFALRRWFFPLSRLWAAARACHGDAERFWDEVPMPGRLEHRGRLSEVLARFETARASVNAIEAEWRRVMFSGEESSEHYRVAVEAARIEARHAYNATRRHFRFMLSRKVPRVRMAIETPEETAAIYGAALSGLAPFVAPPEPMPSVEVSRTIPSAVGVDYWLRFDSPSPRLADQVVARVHQPVGAKDPPTIIFGHGICVEFDHWRGMIDECRALAALGFRVIRPEGPWHGRRVPDGSFGGEHVIAAFPTGALDTFTGALREWTVLADWARRHSGGPLVFGGSSLGALTAQLAADCSRDWPERLRPDALFLVTHTGDVAEAVLKGALTTMWSDPTEAAHRGWNEDLAGRYLSLLAPSRDLLIRPERIVSVLGQRDVVLPFASGKQLIERWRVPEDNAFIWDRGHFSVPMALVRNDAPQRRIAAVARAI